MTEVTMFSSVGARACSRCGKELTDAASMEAGVGPICRKLDNALLARIIPGSPVNAQALASRIPVEALPESTRPTFGNVVADLVDFANKDWRKTVKRIEWILSWSPAASAKNALIEVVRTLGYIGLAALLAGEAATGATTVEFVNGRLFLYGPRNKAGRLAFKKLAGYKFHAATLTSKAAWSAPANTAEAFKLVVMTHWPNVSGLDEAVAAAAAAPPAAIPAPSKPAVVISLSPPVKGWIWIQTPYNGAFVSALKSAVPYKSRKWTGKVWEVEATYLSAVKSLVQKHFQVEAAAA